MDEHDWRMTVRSAWMSPSDWSRLAQGAGPDCLSVLAANEQDWLEEFLNSTDWLILTLNSSDWLLMVLESRSDFL